MPPPLGSTVIEEWEAGKALNALLCPSANTAKSTLEGIGLDKEIGPPPPITTSNGSTLKT